MAEETREQGLKAHPQDGDPTANAADKAPRSTVRAPYAAPQLRYLGKVAELTFAGGSVVVEHGQHTLSKG